MEAYRRVIVDLPTRQIIRKCEGRRRRSLRPLVRALHIR